jgi:hypothetical protein
MIDCPAVGMAAVATMLAWPGIAPAQTIDAAPPAPDKGAYSVFDPTPVDQMRALCTDRPTKSTSPCTVDAGHLQIESDLFNVTVDRGGGVTTTTWLATNPTVKLGLTNTIDAEVNLAPYVSVETRDRASGNRTHVDGVGDLYLRLKWNLVGDDGGVVAFSISPYLKLPTARSGIGDGAVEGGVIAPVNFNLPANWSLVIDPELDIVKNGADDGRHINTSGLLSLSRGVSKTVTASVEIWTDTDFDPAGSRTQVSGDLGLAYVPSNAPNWQFDGGVNFGLNRRTPAAQAYLGVSRRF